MLVMNEEEVVGVLIVLANAIVWRGVCCRRWYMLEVCLIVLQLSLA